MKGKDVSAEDQRRLVRAIDPNHGGYLIRRAREPEMVSMPFTEMRTCGDLRFRQPARNPDEAMG